MAHCYSVSLQIGDTEQEICTLVPGNGDLRDEVAAAQKEDRSPRKPTDEEIDRALAFHLKHHRHDAPDDRKRTLIERDRREED